MESALDDICSSQYSRQEENFGLIPKNYFTLARGFPHLLLAYFGSRIDPVSSDFAGLIPITPIFKPSLTYK
jgi:hypothetical protein